MSFKTRQLSLAYLLFIVVIQIVLAPEASGAILEKIECGIDHSRDVVVGSNIPLRMYPWVGILYYVSHDKLGEEERAVTTVVLIQQEFVIAAAADVGPMPKYNFREHTKVILAGDWVTKPRRVRNYVIHPEYGQTLNTVALVQLKDIVRSTEIKPVCPPPNFLRDPEFYIIKFDEDYNVLKKQVIPADHVPGRMCKDFYVTANLYAKRMRPPYVACAMWLKNFKVCEWNAGAALVARDVWGRWQLLGLGVRGPGCSAPSRYLDMMSYYPWIEASLSKFRQITISKINNQKYVLRSAGEEGGEEKEGDEKHLMRYGACDPEEKKELVYRDYVRLVTDNRQYKLMTYNMTIKQQVEYTCLTLELVNASASSEMHILHTCPRRNIGSDALPIYQPCYMYRESTFDITVYVIYAGSCTFEMVAWGVKKDMTLLDIQEWKWEEGTYYEDFNLKRVEYRGQADLTGFGFEPLDDKLWVPEFDFWTTTEFDVNITTPRARTQPTYSSTTPHEDEGKKRTKELQHPGYPKPPRVKGKGKDKGKDKDKDKGKGKDKDKGKEESEEEYYNDIFWEHFDRDRKPYFYG